jgi:hypothetical protein
VLTKGQRVQIRAKGSSDDWCEGTVLVLGMAAASQSVGLLLNGFVRARFGFVGGGLALFVGETIEGLDGQEYEIEAGDEGWSEQRFS